ncbi:MAG: hypothetical protein MK317_09240 [Pseudomonadales bacterium]|nr:hypothetical protein [Pseudomonadales bacterium]|tara:strand:+ start:6861 stop:7265 length:405 start_codon:yes stop_codon:yes gene_type:complete
MVRARKQAPQAASGQEYGAAKGQLESQDILPLPADVSPLPRPQSISPSETPAAFGPSVRPTEPITEPAMQQAPASGVTVDRARNFLQILPVLLPLASSDYSSPATRRAIRQMERISLQMPREAFPPETGSHGDT